jgi:hypothetical protein
MAIVRLCTKASEISSVSIIGVDLVVYCNVVYLGMYEV